VEFKHRNRVKHAFEACLNGYNKYLERFGLATDKAKEEETDYHEKNQQLHQSRDLSIE